MHAHLKWKTRVNPKIPKAHGGTKINEKYAKSKTITLPSKWVQSPVVAPQNVGSAHRELNATLTQT